MHLFFSEINDVSTNYVIDWLIYMKQKYIRYNGKMINSTEFDFSQLLFSFDFGNRHNNSQISLNNSDILKNIKSIWFRRPYNGVKDLYDPIENFSIDIPKDKINNLLRQHNKILKDFIVNLVENKCKTVLGSYNIFELNKPEILLLAKQTGLNIPNTIITNSYDDVKKFYLRNNKMIICKALHEGVSYHPKSINSGFVQYTTLLSEINELPKVFAYSLFQEYIEKSFEIRIVYLDGTFFPMAIFSQNEKKTIVDFRNMNQKLPNRMIPYVISKSLKDKLQALMMKIGLNMASIDLLKATNNKIYFLEINPVGQYDFVSKNCKYDLDNKIAKYLTNEKY